MTLQEMRGDTIFKACFWAIFMKIRAQNAQVNGVELKKHKLV